MFFLEVSIFLSSPAKALLLYNHLATVNTNKTIIQEGIQHVQTSKRVSSINAVDYLWIKEVSFYKWGLCHRNAPSLAFAELHTSAKTETCSLVKAA